MVELKFTFPSIDDAISFLGSRTAIAGGQAATPTPAAPAAPAAETAKPGKPAKTEAAAATKPSANEQKKDEKAAAPATPASDAKPAAAEVKAVKYEDTGIAEKIAAALGDKAAEGYAERRTAVVALLTEFGVKKGPELKPEQYESFTARINALLQPEDALA